MNTFQNISRTVRAALLAGMLASVGLGAAPAYADPSISGGFSLEVRPQGGDQKQLRQFQNKDFRPDEFFNWCLTDRQIRRGLRSYGFSDIEFIGNLSRNRVRVEATYEDDWVYSMRIHRCTGVVDRIKRLYPAWDDEYDW